MRSSGIINGALAAAIASTRHTDLIVISDAGFPAGPRSGVIDLALVPGLPPFAAVLEAVLAELTVEASFLASETADVNPAQHSTILGLLPDASELPHDELKILAVGAVFVVRSGDNTPYSNVILRAGYPF